MTTNAHVVAAGEPASAPVEIAPRQTVVSVILRLLSSRLGLFCAAAPAYLALFIIHIRHTLPSLRAGEVPPDLGYSAKTAVVLQFSQTLCLAYLFIVYAALLWNWPRLRLAARVVALNAVLIAAMAWTLLPANSSDVLEYIGFGRLVSVYHVSPYDHTYSEFTDAFAPEVTWDEPMPYGPLPLPIFAVAGVLSQKSTILAVYSIKLAWLFLHLVNAFLVYRIARGLSVEPAFALSVFAFNPLMLLETVGNGHNDGLVVFFGLAAVLAMQRQQPRWSLCLAVLGTFAKMSGAFMAAGVAALLVRRRQWPAVVQPLVACGIAVAIIFLLLPGSAAALTVLNSQWQYSDESLHTVIIDVVRALSAALGRPLEYEDVFTIDRIVFTTMFVAVCAWRYSRIADVETLIDEVARVTVILLLLFAVSVYPWYMSWVVPLAALTTSTALRRSALVACATAVMLYAVPFAWVEQIPSHAVWSALRLITAFLIPAAVWAYLETREAVSHPAPPRFGR